MKRKLLTFVMLLSLIISMVPSVTFAATINVDRSSSDKIKNSTAIKNILKYHKPTQAQIRQVGSELEYYKQYILETIEEIYDESNDNEYATEIKTILDTYYNDLEMEINNVDSLDKLISGTVEFLGMTIPDFTDEVYIKVLVLQTLVSWDNDVIKGTEKVSDIKAKLNKVINDAMDCYIKSYDYNDYYESIVNGGKQELLDEVKKVNDFMTLATVTTKLAYKFDTSFPLPVVSLDLSDINASCPYGDDDYYYDDEEDDDMSYESFVKYMGMTYIPELELEGEVFTNRQVDDVKTYTIFYIDTYVNKQLVAANYMTGLDNIKQKANTAIEKIEASDNVEEIATIYENTLNYLINKTGVEYKNVTSTTINRIDSRTKKLKKVYLDKKVYSEDGLMTNEQIFDYVDQILSNTFKDVEIPDADTFIKKLETKLKTTKTYKQELAELRKELLKELSVFKNNKKYNQAKIKAIINEAAKKINASTDMDEIYNLFYEYYERAENAINKYKITTKKTGKGTITKSKIVTYGSNFTVKMTPKKGYKIKSVTVDGKKVKNKTKYTFKKVVKAHTIKVVFVKKK